MKKCKVRVFNIKWDTDGAEVDLPSFMILNIETNDLDDLDYLEDCISEYLSDHTGFCHDGFDYEITKN